MHKFSLIETRECLDKMKKPHFFCGSTYFEASFYISDAFPFLFVSTLFFLKRYAPWKKDSADSAWRPYLSPKVRMVTSCGCLNLELHCNIAPRSRKFHRHLETGWEQEGTYKCYISPLEMLIFCWQTRLLSLAFCWDRPFSGSVLTFFQWRRSICPTKGLQRKTFDFSHFKLQAANFFGDLLETSGDWVYLKIG